MFAPGHRAFEGFASRPGESAGRGRGYVPGWASTFEEMLITEVIPDMDSSPRTIANPRNRALAGLSRGGGQAFDIGLQNLDVFRFGRRIQQRPVRGCRRRPRSRGRPVRWGGPYPGNAVGGLLVQ